MSGYVLNISKGYKGWGGDIYKKKTSSYMGMEVSWDGRNYLAGKTSIII